MSERPDLHPRVRIGNGTPCWTKKRRTVWGVLLDGRWHEYPRCTTQDGALRKAVRLSQELFEAEAVSP